MDVCFASVNFGIYFDELGDKVQIVLKKLNELKPYEKNPRRNGDAVDYVAKSIENFGFKVPIVIDKEGIIVAGHTRYKAAKKIGLTEVPCIVADDLSDEQIKAFRLADNKVSELSRWDYALMQKELEGIAEDMSVFGFANANFGDGLSPDDFISDEDKNKKEYVCEHCGRVFEV